MEMEINSLEITNKNMTRTLAREGIVLLENDGVLPFIEEVKKIALFGRGARKTVKGGTGSGDVNVRDFVSIEQGLQHAGYEIVTEQWLDAYDNSLEDTRQTYDKKLREYSAQKGIMAGVLYMMGNPMVEPDFPKLEAYELGTCSADAAVYVLTRNSGEGADRKLEAGDYYLTAQELSDIRLLAEHYENTVLLLNVSGVIDIKEIKEISGINAIVYISQGGSAFGDAVADVLSGKETPSAKLTTTWAVNYEDYPGGSEFAGINRDEDDSYYREDIFVGYRYFDTVGIAPMYPFGYGGSYTDFSVETKKVFVERGQICIEVEVQNIGKHYSGKEVVQVYTGSPEGSIRKPYQELRAFAKTSRLLPGEKEIIHLEFAPGQMASYDERTSAYVLEAGDYRIYVGNSSRNTKPVAIVSLDKNIVTEQCKHLFGEESFVVLNIERAAAPKEHMEKSIPRIRLDAKDIENRKHSYGKERIRISAPKLDRRITLEDVQNHAATLEELVGQLDTEELVRLCVGGARVSAKDFSVVGNASDTIPGAAGNTTKQLLDSRGIPSLLMADGPAGIRVNPKYYEKDGEYFTHMAEDPIFGKLLPEEALQMDLPEAKVCYQYCTAVPVATMLAQSWNLDLLKAAGELVRSEMEELKIDLWLAPGMNIQRNPLGGRNFEYYSEDPYISGRCAAAITIGVQLENRDYGTTIKHLAANSQETNRNYNNIHVSERALREIYLKGFEICIKEAHPLAAMTSVNLINGIHAANHFDMLSCILRDEWGFDGLVMTDWGTTSAFGVDLSTKKYGCSTSEGCIQAGNDLIMPGTQADEDRLWKAVEEGVLDIADLQWCAQHILGVTLEILNGRK